MPSEQQYTIGELATLAGVTPRTIRYYVSIGLLASPGQAGPGARYGDSHLARLRLIRRLQREHLPLGEIVVRLEGLDDRAVDAALSMGEAATLEEVEPPLSEGSMPVGEMPAGPGRHPVLGPAPGSALEYINRLKEEPPGMDRAPLARAFTFSPPATEGPSGAQRSQWERVTLSQNVELHIRRPLGRLEQKQIERLIRLGRELLERGDTK